MPQTSLKRQLIYCWTAILSLFILTLVLAWMNDHRVENIDIPSDRTAQLEHEQK